MTPAEMREMAAKACDNVSDGDVECLNQAPDEASRRYHAGGRDAAAMCARIVRAIPIPDMTAADGVLETAQWKLRKIGELSEIMMTGKASYLNRIKELSSQALAAIDAAKAKGGG